VPITFWYVVLAISVIALVSVGIAIYRRIRRLSRASDTQFRRALKEEEQKQ
jgi:hypothetical protein